MYENISKIQSHLIENFGNCSKCMRQALLFSLASWAAFAIVFAVWPDRVLVTATAMTAAVLTSLWLLHIGVYSLRSAQWAKSQIAAPDSALAQPNRREVLTTALRAVAVGMVVSLPTPFAAYAAQCGNLCTHDADCGGPDNGWCCKNVAPVNAGYVCNQCKKC